MNLIFQAKELFLEDMGQEMTLFKLVLIGAGKELHLESALLSQGKITLNSIVVCMRHALL